MNMNRKVRVKGRIKAGTHEGWVGLWLVLILGMWAMDLFIYFALISVGEVSIIFFIFFIGVGLGGESKQTDIGTGRKI